MMIPPKKGTLFADKFLIQDVLGEGGMGIVVAAFHQHLQHQVAIKFLLNDADLPPAARKRFLREAQMLSQLTNRHIVRVFDIGESEDGSLYLVLEYLRGESLWERLRKQRKLSVEQSIHVGMQVCCALFAAHQAGIVHRDIKPSNLFLAVQKDGTEILKVLDFGISKVADSQDQTELTGTGETLGSPAYMSPEQIRDPRLVSATSDVWALGVTMFQLLSGIKPFSGNSPMDVAVQIVCEPPPRLSELCPELDVELVDVVERCLEKQPENRFPSVVHLARAMEPWATEVDAFWLKSLPKSVEEDEAWATLEISTSALSSDAVPTMEPPLVDSQTLPELTQATIPLPASTKELPELSGVPASPETLTLPVSPSPSRLRYGMLVVLAICGIGVLAFGILQKRGGGVPYPGVPQSSLASESLSKRVDESGQLAGKSSPSLSAIAPADLSTTRAIPVVTSTTTPLVAPSAKHIKTLLKKDKVTATPLTTVKKKSTDPFGMEIQ
jgi:eukaryotic-like serine/threonine-protein kinase